MASQPAEMSAAAEPVPRAVGGDIHLVYLVVFNGTKPDWGADWARNKRGFEHVREARVKAVGRALRGELGGNVRGVGFNPAVVPDFSQGIMVIRMGGADFGGLFHGGFLRLCRLCFRVRVWAFGAVLSKGFLRLFGQKIGVRVARSGQTHYRQPIENEWFLPMFYPRERTARACLGCSGNAGGSCNRPRNRRQQGAVAVGAAARVTAGNAGVAKRAARDWVNWRLFMHAIWGRNRQLRVVRNDYHGVVRC